MAKRFVNPHSHTVGVYVKGVKVYLSPYLEYGTRFQSPDGVYIIEGDEFSEQVAPRGPLHQIADNVENTRAKAVVNVVASVATMQSVPAPVEVIPVVEAAPAVAEPVEADADGVEEVIEEVEEPAVADAPDEAGAVVPVKPAVRQQPRRKVVTK